MPNDVREDLAHHAVLDVVRGRALVRAGLLSIQVGKDLELRGRIERTVEPGVRLQILVLLRHGDHVDVARFGLVVHVLQLDQLLGAERSPEGAVGGQDDVRLGESLAERDVLAVLRGKQHVGRMVADLEAGGLEPPI